MQKNKYEKAFEGLEIGGSSEELTNDEITQFYESKYAALSLFI
jgi:hypothetical protein